MSLTRESILGFKYADKVQKLHVAEWNADVFIRVLSGAEVDALAREVNPQTKQVGPNFRGRLAALVLCDESGERLFTDKDGVELGKHPATVLSKIMEAAMAFNRLGEEGITAALGESSGDQT